MNSKVYAIEKHMSFSAAHLLEGLDEGHPCKNFHGHNYDVVIRIESDKLDKHGFVIDFNELKEFKKDFIDDQLDHSVIIINNSYDQIKDNDLFKKVYLLPGSSSNSTVEVLSRHICNVLNSYFKENNFRNYNKLIVRVSETNGNTGEFSKIYKYNEDDSVKDLKGQIEELESNIEDHATRIIELEEKVDELENKIDELENNDDDEDLAIGKDYLESKLEDLQKHVDDIASEFDERIDDVTDDVATLWDKENFDEKFSEFDERINDVTDDVVTLESRMETLEEENKDTLLEFEERIDDIATSLNRHTDSVEKKIDLIIKETKKSIENIDKLKKRQKNV